MSFVSSIVDLPFTLIKSSSEVPAISIKLTLFISLITSESFIFVSNLLSVDGLKE